YVDLPGAQHAFDVFPSIRSAHVIRAVERFLDYVLSTARATEGAARASERRT
ncbi:MAG: alpha/beta hydrolase, partial [Actinomycetota bacterium]